MQPDQQRFVADVQEAVGRIVRGVFERFGSCEVNVERDIAERPDTDGSAIVCEPTGITTIRITPGVFSVPANPPEDPPPLGRPYKPAKHARTVGEFCEHIEKDRPFAAKIIDGSTGAMLVYCADTNVYFRNSPHALRALRHYGVKP